MTVIANLKKLENGSFEGKIKTAMLNCHLKIQPISDVADSDKHPHYRVKIGSYEAGAGWNRVSENQNPYISLQVDDPIFPNPIYANLIEKNGEYLLLWQRRS